MSPRSAVAASVTLALAVALIGGLAWVGSGGSAVWSGVPVLVLCGGLALVVQLVAWVPSALAKSEKYFDLTGSLTYLTVTAVALGLSGVSLRGVLVMAMVWVWALRLGSFLFRRIHKAGRDPRFDKLKVDPLRFMVVWNIQAMWVALTALAALIVLTQQDQAPLGVMDLVGGLVWLAGFVIEVVADAQKSAFNGKPENEGRWVHTGLWAWSQHPNYFGEIVLWTGIALIGAGQFEGGQWVGLVSPVFVALLLTRVSGIPLLDQRAKAKFGDDPGYAAYVARTSKLVLWPPG